MATCPVCGGKIGLLNKVKTSDGEICPSCAAICPSHATRTTMEIQKYWEINHARWAHFTVTQVLKSLVSDCITIDSTHRLFVFGDVKKLKEEPIVFGFDEVESYQNELIGGKTVTKKKGGITRAVIGGAIAGPVGAIVGSSTAKSETKTTGGIRMTMVNFDTYAGKVQRASAHYPTGFTEFLDRCIAEAPAKNAPDAPAAVSAADEILKYKALLDQGILTPEEFEAKKAQLLGL